MCLSLGGDIGVEGGRHLERDSLIDRSLGGAGGWHGVGTRDSEWVWDGEGAWEAGCKNLGGCTILGG